MCQGANYKVPNETFVQLRSDFEEVYPNASATSTESAMNMVFTADLLVKRITALLQPFNLTPTSGLVLSLLADSELPLAPNEIADRLIITRATVTGLLDTLERWDYVERTPHPTDRRKLLIQITDEGRQVAHDFRPVVHRHQQQWFDVLDEAEKQQLIDILHRLQANLMDSD